MPGWSPAFPGGTHLYGAGGGTSQVVAMPKYQQGVVPNSISDYFHTGFLGRSTPDIGAIADPNTGFLIGLTQTFPDGSVKYSEYRIGGTSLASPAMAGMEALADQAAGHPHGFANPAIYRLNGSSAVHDIVSPEDTMSDVRIDFINGVDATAGYRTSLRVFNQTGTIFTRRGYDDVTGIGTPKAVQYTKQLGH